MKTIPMLKLLETFPLPSIVIDRDLKIVHINSLGLSLLDVKLGQILNLNITSIFPTIDFSKEIDVDTSCTFSVGGNPLNFHLQFKITDNNEGYGVIYLIKNDSVSEESDQNQIKYNFKVLESFINSIHDGVLLFNEKGVLVYANEIATNYFDISFSNHQAFYIWNFFDLFSGKEDWDFNKNVTLDSSRYSNFEFNSKGVEKKVFSINLNSVLVDNTIYNYILTFTDITDSSNDKTALDERNSQIEMFHKNIPAVIFQFVFQDIETNYFSYVSDSFKELFGFNLAINDLAWYQSIAAKPKDLIAFMGAVNESITGMTELKYIDIVDLPSGRSAWFEINAIPSQKNNSLVYNGIILDITDRKELESVHIKTNEFNNSVLFNIPADIAVFDSNHKYLFINGNAIANEELRNWLIGKTDFDYCNFKGISTAMAEGRRVYFERARDTHEQVDWIDEINKNGEKVFVLRRFFPFYMGEEFVYMIGYGVDITELRRAQNMLSETERQNELILKAAPDGVVMMDDDWNITFWNPKAEQIFGWKSEEVLGNNLSEVLFRNKAKRMIKESLFDPQENIDTFDKSRVLELKAYSKRGTKFPIELTIVPIDEKENEFNYCIFIRDITERKEKEYEIEQQNKLLINKNRELEQFTYITSHDLQEPLLTLITYSKMLEEEYATTLEGDGAIFLKYITKSSQRMRLLIHSLMQYARINKLATTTRINFDQIINEVLIELATMITAYNAKIEVVNSVTFDCYPIHIKSLLINLISNAIKFSEKKGVPQIKIICEDRENDWLFKVEDNGIGIDRKNKDQIFLIFKRLHSEKDYIGQGIGLAHCKKIVEIHQGEIWVDSELGKGSNFFFTVSKNLKIT